MRLRAPSLSPSATRALLALAAAACASALPAHAQLRPAEAVVWHQGSPGAAGEPEAGDRFGLALATGDFDGDGRADLAISTPARTLPASPMPGRSTCSTRGPLASTPPRPGSSSGSRVTRACPARRRSTTSSVRRSPPATSTVTASPTWRSAPARQPSTGSPWPAPSACSMAPSLASSAATRLASTRMARTRPALPCRGTPPAWRGSAAAWPAPTSTATARRPGDRHPVRAAPARRHGCPAGRRSSPLRQH